MLAHDGATEDPPRVTSPPGTLLFDRFRVLREAGRGGMGVVLRCTDETSGGHVALKLLLDLEGAERFLRESEILAGLGHPGIVRHVAHGRSETGTPWLAMEWLEGETMGERLRRGPLPAATVKTCAEAIARALGAAHAVGVVHRDVKPGNVFLAGPTEAPRVTVLDFGIAARPRAELRTLTSTGALLGTPYYMAPEQVRGERTIDPRADVWSLGVMLYELLSGQRPFEHESPVAVLAALLLEEPPPLVELVPNVSLEFAALVHRCLDKRPEARPANGDALADAIEAIDLGARAESPSSAGLTDREQRIVFAVLGLHAARGDDATVSAAGWSTEGTTSSPEGALRATAEAHGARTLPLGEGALLFLVPEGGTPTEQAQRAARLALALGAAAPSVALALAGGRAELGARLAVGEVVRRAEKLALGDRSDARSPVRIDELSAGLVAARYEVAHDGQGLWLVGERAVPTPASRPGAPLFGRDRELRVLLDVASEAHEEPMARIAVLLGPPGTGKSRMLAELEHSLRDRPGRLLAVRGEPLHAGAPHGLVAGLLRSAAGIVPGEPLAERRTKLRTMIHAAVPAGDRLRALTLLGDVARTPIAPDEADPALLGALDDPQLRGDLVEQAFTTWLGGLARAEPLTVLVDDVAFVDGPSLVLLLRALRACLDAPILLVLASRDAEGAWSREPACVPVPLGRLAPRACRALLACLAPETPEPLALRILERAEGNPLFLEEMALAARRGDPLEVLPTSVLAVVERRLAELAPEARRTSRAVAILGAHASLAAIAHLLGARSEGELAAVEASLALLVRRELLCRDVEARAPSYRFRQPLARDAAYAMLTEQDRRTGHRLAAELLEASPEREPDVIATHLDRAGAGEQAATAYAEAAERALGAHDLSGAIARADRGLALLGAGSPVALFATRARAHRYRAEYAAAFADAEQSVALAAPGSGAWLDAAGTLLSAAGQLGRLTETETILEALLAQPLEAPRDEATRRAWVVTTCRAGSVLLGVDRARSRAALTQAETLLHQAGDEPLARGWCEVLSASHALLDGDVGAFALGTERAVAAYDRAGDARDACNQRVRLGNAWTALGVPERAEPVLEAALADATRMGLRLVEGYALQNLGHARARLGRGDAQATLERALARAESLGDARLAAGVRLYLAELWRSEAPERAAVEAERAWHAVKDVPGFGAVAAAHHALALLALGRLGQARDASELAQRALAAQPDAFEEGEASIRRAMVEVLRAEGAAEAARAAAWAAWERIAARARHIGDPALRRSFLEAVPDHRALAAAAA